jgi:nucleotide-binding universal stress UspA family protein
LTVYKKILVPTDGSETATAGLQEAIKLAKDQRAQIRLIHVVDELVMGSAVGTYIVTDNIIDALRSAGNAILAAARQIVQEAGVPVETQLVEAFGGQAGEYILKAAQDWPADIIVCGTHGRRGLRRIVLGSDAEYLVRRSSIPILLTRAAGVEV